MCGVRKETDRAADLAQGAVRRVLRPGVRRPQARQTQALSQSGMALFGTTLGRRDPLALLTEGDAALTGALDLVAGVACRLQHLRSMIFTVPRVVDLGGNADAERAPDSTHPTVALEHVVAHPRPVGRQRGAPRAPRPPPGSHQTALQNYLTGDPAPPEMEKNAMTETHETPASEADDPEEFCVCGHHKRQHTRRGARCAAVEPEPTCSCLGFRYGRRSGYRRR